MYSESLHTICEGFLLLIHNHAMSTRIDQLQAFLSASPDDPFLHHALALEFVKEGDETSAEKHFRHNLDNAPQYVASYYHLGKLLERDNRSDDAMATYERGMVVAKAAGDGHTYNELQSAYEDLAY
jgi:tetratricopeptide (TPR) repeat protein